MTTKTSLEAAVLDLLTAWEGITTETLSGLHLELLRPRNQPFLAAMDRLKTAIVDTVVNGVDSDPKGGGGFFKPCRNIFHPVGCQCEGLKGVRNDPTKP